MVHSPLIIILEMVRTLLSNTLSTLGRITDLFGELLVSLGIISSYGGIAAFIISVVVLAVVVFLLAKFVLGSGKLMLILIPLAVIVIFLIILGTVV